MPYITRNNRCYIDAAMKLLVEELFEVDGYKPVTPGLVNYVITRIVTQVMKPDCGWTYSSLSRALAVFRDAEAEMRRRLLDQYEDEAIKRNGDIPEYE